MALNHFLDANVLIGSRINWDGQHHYAYRYMQRKGFRRHTSERVYSECTRVFGRFRRTVLRYLKYMEQNFPAHPNPLTLDRTIDNLTSRLVRSLETRREQDVLKSFVHGNMGDLRNVALGTEEDRRAFGQEVIDVIKAALDSLDRDCRDDPSAPVFCYTCCPENYDTIFPERMSTLIDALSYKPDTLVILDSYYLLVNHIREEICFVTTDVVHILRNRSTIETTLPGITVHEPRSFLTNEWQDHPGR